MWPFTETEIWQGLYALDLCAMGIFVFSYYRQCYRQGYRIDFWHMQLFFACILPNMILLPFAKNDMNQIVVGHDMEGMVRAVPIVFLITLCGYFAMILGGSLWRVRLGIGARKTAAQILSVVPRCSLMLMSSKNVLILQTGICFLLQCMILSIYFSLSGFAFDLRGFTFAYPALRPVALVISTYSVVIASHCLARYTEKKERILLGCTLLLTCGLVFFGARSNLVIIYINVLICYFVKQRGRISLFRLITVIAVIAVGGFYLGSLRSGDYSPTEFAASFAFLILYGNTFSDLRDFAWVYANWDHAFWAGKTYLAAVMAFVPRFISEFRETWGLGVKTASLAGFDAQMHPGLRPGVFGEGFFNFGLLGVVAVGLMLGIVARRVDIDVKRALDGPRPSMIKAFSSTALLSVAAAFAITSGFSSLYVLGGIYLFTWFCVSVQRFFSPSMEARFSPGGAHL